MTDRSAIKAALLLNMLEISKQEMDAIRAEIDRQMVLLEEKAADTITYVEQLKKLKALPEQQARDFARTIDLLERGVFTAEPASTIRMPGPGVDDVEVPAGLAEDELHLQESRSEHDRLMQHMHEARVKAGIIPEGSAYIYDKKEPEDAPPES